MLHLVEVTMNIPHDELGRISRKLRNRLLHDVVPRTGGITVVCSDGTEVDLNWEKGAISYNGYRSTLRHFARETALPTELHYLIGKRLDSFQYAGSRGYLVMDSGDTLRLDCKADGSMVFTPAKAGYCGNV